MKYVVTILITAIVVFGGAYVYFKGLPKFPSYNSAPTSTQSGEATVKETFPPEASPSGSPGTEVKAGGILSMSAYSIMVPSDWQYSKAGSVAGQTDTLKISKDVYSITISQGAFGGGGCLYPGDSDAEMAQRFTSFMAVTDQSGDSLRVGTLSTGGMAVCQSSGSGWGDITSFGHISISAPTSPDPTILTQINSILSSLKKI